MCRKCQDCSVSARKMFWNAMHFGIMYPLLSQCSLKIQLIFDVFICTQLTGPILGDKVSPFLQMEIKVKHKIVEGAPDGSGSCGTQMSWWLDSPSLQKFLWFLKGFDSQASLNYMGWRHPEIWSCSENLSCKRKLIRPFLPYLPSRKRRDIVSEWETSTS